MCVIQVRVDQAKRDTFISRSSDFRPRPFDQRIGGEGRPVDDLINLRRGDSGLAANLLHPVEDHICRGNIDRQHFGRKRSCADLMHDIGKRPADINAKPDRLLGYGATRRSIQATLDMACEHSTRDLRFLSAFPTL